MRRPTSFAAVLILGLILGLPSTPGAADPPSDDDLRGYAVHVNRTPIQKWPGYGVYLGNGLVLTASHVPGNFADTKPTIRVGDQDAPTELVRQGSLDGVDLTLLSVKPDALPVRMRMRRLPLCDKAAFPGESVIVITPESAVRSHVLPPSEIPQAYRARFGTAIADVATTGNSGSGVLDTAKICLLGVISRKISVGRLGAPLRTPGQIKDIAKYFVPVEQIRAFIPSGVSF